MRNIIVFLYLLFGATGFVEMAALEPDPAGGEEVDMPSTWYETYLRRIEEKRIAEAQGKNGPRKCNHG